MINHSAAYHVSQQHRRFAILIAYMKPSNTDWLIDWLTTIWLLRTIDGYVLSVDRAALWDDHSFVSPSTDLATIDRPSVSANLFAPPTDRPRSAIYRCCRSVDRACVTRWYWRGFGLGIEVGKLVDVQFPVAVLVELPQQHDDLVGREVERFVLQDHRRLLQWDVTISITVILLELGHQTHLSALTATYTHLRTVVNCKHCDLLLPAGNKKSLEYNTNTVTLM